MKIFRPLGFEEKTIPIDSELIRIDRLKDGPDFYNKNDGFNYTRHWDLVTGLEYMYCKEINQWYLLIERIFTNKKGEKIFFYNTTGCHIPASIKDEDIEYISYLQKNKDKILMPCIRCHKQTIERKTKVFKFKARGYKCDHCGEITLADTYIKYDEKII